MMGDPRLFTGRAFATGVRSVALQFSAAFGLFLIVFQYLECDSALEAGLAVGPPGPRDGARDGSLGPARAVCRGSTCSAGSAYGVTNAARRSVARSVQWASRDAILGRGSQRR
jgi:hypothetical protein